MEVSVRMAREWGGEWENCMWSESFVQRFMVREMRRRAAGSVMWTCMKKGKD